MATFKGDLFQVIEPVVLLARTSGFLPVTYEKQGCKYLFQRSLKYVLYNYTLALVLMLTSMIGLCDDLDADRSIRMQNPNIKYIIFFDLGEIIATVFVGIVTAPLQIKIFLENLERSRTNGPDPCPSLFNIISSILIYDVILWSLNTSQLSVFDQRFTTLYITYFLVFVQQIPFCFFARLIRRRIEGLNYALDLGLTTVQKNNVNNQWVSCVKSRNYKNAKSVDVFSYDRLNDPMKLVEETDDVVEAVQ
ncbi:hypothetical protein MTP99_007881 [Tenebrio molitor]|nr:hypothetical protein MTP99_007881 [Tenebrio molitor]